MKQAFKECTIGNKRYRIVRCKNCGKIFNAYENGNPSGILYNCIETISGCRTNKNGIESVSKEKAYEYILKELGTNNPDSWMRKELDNIFSIKKACL